MCARARLLPLALALLPGALAAETRPLRPDDLARLREVSDPRLSPDGRFVAYTLATTDAAEDAATTDLFLVPAAGGEALRLTSGPKDETRPRFSPDGEWIAFLADRDGKGTEVHLLSRRGGEAHRLTDYAGPVSDLAWSPDSRRLALVVADADPDATDEAAPEAKKKTPRPIVVRRLQFQRDGEGFLGEVRRHVHVFDLATKTSVQVTSGPFDDAEPAWSPDGRRIAFVSNRVLPDPDRSQDADVFVVEAQPGRVPRRLPTGPGADASPAFSPDGRLVAYVAGGDPGDLWYGASHVAVVPVDGGARRSLTAELDRNVLRPRFAPDGLSLLFLVEDRGNRHLARVGVEGGAVERVLQGERDVSAFDLGPGGEIVVLESSAHQPPEISAVDGRGLRRLTRANDELLKTVALGRVERIQATSRDGTVVDAFLSLPPGHAPGRRVPTLLWIHGGPADQYSTAFDAERHVLAGAGYAVVAANPRGSTGRGTAFSRAIWADWGNRDFEDVMAAVDQAVAAGVADPDRLGVGGWSYGGILTNAVVSKTTRFKAAVSGAGMANHLAGYGTDHYQYEWEVELGLPWRARDVWLRLSAPFFDVEKVETPTLYLCGALDANVPLLATEQMYQALRRVGRVPTELVVYPGEWHSIGTPSHAKDRLERYLAWFDRFLRPATAPAGRPPEATSLLGRPLHAPEIAERTREGLEKSLAGARADFAKSPDGVDAAVALGRRHAALGQYREAIAVYTRALAKHPDDPRLLRHRGHRLITVRELDGAVADLSRAARLVEGRPDEPEPGSDPARPPTATLQFSILYHLGLAHYLKGDFAAAEKAYRGCLERARGSDDRLVAATDWLYTTLRRLGRSDEAARLLEPVHAGLDVTEDRSYLNRILMYKGVYGPDDLLRVGGDELTRETYGYAVGFWHLVNGREDEARAAFERVVAGPQWPAFGHVAAEADLARMR